jgi:hypothetical protein
MPSRVFDIARTICCTLRNGKELNEARVNMTYSIEELASQSFVDVDLDKIIINVEGLYPSGTKLTDLLYEVASSRWLGGCGLDKLKADLKAARDWRIIKLLMPLLHGFEKSTAELSGKLQAWYDQGEAIRGLHRAGCHEQAAELCQRSASVKPGRGRCSLGVLDVVARITSNASVSEQTRLVRQLINEWQQYAEAAQKPQAGRRKLNKYNAAGLAEAFAASTDTQLRMFSKVSWDPKEEALDPTPSLDPELAL